MAISFLKIDGTDLMMQFMPELEMLEMLSSQEESTWFFNDVLSGHSTPEINIELEEVKHRV